MKIAESLMSIFIGVTIAWFILNMPKVSTFTLDPAPIEYDDSNLALIGTGLATQAPQPPSVMDADTGPAPSVVLMNSQATMPMSPAPLMLSSDSYDPMPPVTVVNPPTSMAPVYGMASPAASPDVVMPTPMAPPVATSFTPMMPPPAAEEEEEVPDA